MTARWVIGRALKDALLYVWFYVALSIVFLLLGSPIFGPLHESLAGALTYNGAMALTAGILWVAMGLIMMRMEHNRGYWETRVGSFSMVAAGGAKLLAALLAVSPLFLYYGRYNARTIDSPVQVVYHPFLWVGEVFRGAWAVPGMLIVALLTWGFIIGGFSAGRNKFVAEHLKKTGRLPNLDYAPEKPKGV